MKKQTNQSISSYLTQQVEMQGTTPREGKINQSVHHHQDLISMRDPIKPITLSFFSAKNQQKQIEQMYSNSITCINHKLDDSSYESDSEVVSKKIVRNNKSKKVYQTNFIRNHIKPILKQFQQKNPDLLSKFKNVLIELQKLDCYYKLLIILDKCRAIIYIWESLLPFLNKKLQRLTEKSQSPFEIKQYCQNTLSALGQLDNLQYYKAFNKIYSKPAVALKKFLQFLKKKRKSLGQNIRKQIGK